MTAFGDGALGVVRAVDYHTAGEPFRIVTDGVPDLPGESVGDRRARAIDSEAAQLIRQLLCFEPRGHADMYGCFVVPPDDAGADLGVLFWHKDGFSTACGHGTIALAAWAAETGVVTVDPDGVTEVRIDVPSGRVSAFVRSVGGAVADVTFRNVPSYVHRRAATVATSRGPVTVDVSFGGAFYASLPAASVGLSATEAETGALTAIGREIKWAVQDAGLAEHASDPRLSGCYGTMLYDDFGDAGPDDAGPAGPHQRSITVFADGEVDRSPCGSGTSARMALLAADGRLGTGRVFTHDSIIGTRFSAQVSDTVTADDSPDGTAVITDITGTAYRTGAHEFTLDPRDALGTGFVLR
jgi:proline racemase